MSTEQITCTRCGLLVSVHGYTPHRRACVRTPRPAVLAEAFLAGHYSSTEKMAIQYGVSTPFIEQQLLLGGVDLAMIREVREWRTLSVPQQGFDKCDNCEIYVVERPELLPKRWRWIINGRVDNAPYLDQHTGKPRTGTLCMGCAQGL